jgi:protein SCO1/2
MILTRRDLLGLSGAIGAACLAGCGDRRAWHGIDVAGTSPPLQFAMTRARDNRAVTEHDYRGRIILLYFGYTFCPDLCPTTLANLTNVLQGMGKDAQRVAVLFVTVDPQRDTLPVLASYVGAFAPEIDGLRGTPDQLASLARRYRVAYSVTEGTQDRPYEVDHSSAVYVFDSSGAARLLVASLSTSVPDIVGLRDDLDRLIQEGGRTGLFAKVRSFI